MTVGMKLSLSYDNNDFLNKILINWNITLKFGQIQVKHQTLICVRQ